MIDRAKLEALLRRQRSPARGTPASDAVIVAYQKQLKAVVTRVFDVVRRYARETGLITDGKFPRLDVLFEREFGDVGRFAERLSLDFIDKSVPIQQRAFERNLHVPQIELSKIIGKRESTRVATVTRSRVAANAGLIKSLVDDAKAKAVDIIETQFTKSFAEESLYGKLSQLEDVTESRAKLIARDQTQKLFSDLAQARQQDLGVSRYIWRGIDDGRERESHVANNDQEFSWDDPPAETGHPGEDVQCRCIAEPVLSSLFD